jgi:uncharacterized membrane protein YphA (DoxX/SURF4 family)
MKQFGLGPPVPLAIMVIAMEIGASVLVLSGIFRWAGALMLGAITLAATFLANRFWDTPLPKRYGNRKFVLRAFWPRRRIHSGGLVRFAGMTLCDGRADPISGN